MNLLSFPSRKQCFKIFFVKNCLNFFGGKKTAAESRDQHSLIDNFAIFFFFAKKLKKISVQKFFLLQFFEDSIF